MKNKIALNSCNKKELEELALSLGEQKFRGSQLYGWIYSNKITDINNISNIPTSFKNKLNEISYIYSISDIQTSVSNKDGTIKLLLKLADGSRIESVLLLDKGRLTACISTQVGCKMGCKFCATATMGFKRNLQVAEILEQIRILEDLSKEYGYSEGRLTNIVFMGMGEPLDNCDNLIKALEIILDEDAYCYSHKRVTVSTSGLYDKLPRLYAMPRPINVAISINATTQSIREKIMPISTKYPLDNLIKTIRELSKDSKAKLTFEYVLIKDINSSTEDARRLLKLINRLDLRVNLIRYNGDDDTFQPPKEEDVISFQRILYEGGVKAFIRKSFGSDILGGCGQLVANYTSHK